jgi:hypothetical protein
MKTAILRFFTTLPLEFLIKKAAMSAVNALIELVQESKIKWDDKIALPILFALKEAIENPDDKK